MGCCFSNEDKLEPTSTSNLLNSTQRKYTENSGEQISARQYRPPDRRTDTHLCDDDLLAVTKMKPLAIQSMNKTFQDQEKLYNEVSRHYQEMTKELHGFKSAFDKETSGIPELTKCIRILVHRCGNAQLQIERRKNCVQIVYSEQTVSRNSLCDPLDAITSIKLFNSMNKHLEKVLDRCQNIQNSINILISDEDQMRLQITKASLSPADGTEAIHNCIDNIKILQNMRNNIIVIKQKSDEKLKDIIESSKGFFDNTN